MPYLICMSTDPENVVRVKSDQQLEEIEKKYPGFTHVCTLLSEQSLFIFLNIVSNMFATALSV